MEFNNVILIDTSYTSFYRFLQLEHGIQWLTKKNLKK